MPLSDAEKQRLIELKRYQVQQEFYQKHPLKWIEDRLGIDPKTIKWSLFPQYLELGFINEDRTYNAEKWDGTPDPLFRVLQNLADWKDTAVESATGTGKTFLAACIVLWFLDVWPNSMVITVAPKESQLSDNVWKEIGKLWPKFEALRPRAKLTQLRIRVKDDASDRDAWQAFGFVCGVGADEESAQKAKGFHAEHMLVIFEETPGIDKAILTAFEDTCTAPHNLRLFLGNPKSEFDTLHQVCLEEFVEHIIISSYDHPNIVTVPEEEWQTNAGPIPGAVSWKRIVKIREKRGVDHPLYKSQVRGICPTGGGQTMFDPDKLDEAKKKLATPIHEWVQDKEKSDYRKLGYKHLVGVTRIYEEVDRGWVNRYILFADVAGDYGDIHTGKDPDYHALIVFDRIKRKPVALIKARGPRDEYIKEILRIASLYKVYWFDRGMDVPPMLAWETDGVGGLTMNEEFKRYPNLYFRRVIDTKDQRVRKKYGWSTNGARDEMMDQLEAWALNEFFDDPSLIVDPYIWKDCKDFVWNPKKSRWEAAPSTQEDPKHDDLVMALAGCLIIDTLIPKPILIVRKEGEEQSAASSDKPLNNIQRHFAAQRKREEQQAVSTYTANSARMNAWDLKKLPRWGL